MAHLQGEVQDGDPALHGGVGGHAKGQGGLAHARPGPDDDEGRGLQAREALVEVEETGRHPGDGLAPVVEGLEPVEAVGQQVMERLEGVGDPPFGDLEDHRLGPVDGRGDVVGKGVAHLGDLAGHADEPAEQGVLFDDAGVAGRVGRRRRVGLQGDEGRRPADGFEQVGPAQLVGHRDRVGRFALAVERAHGIEDVTVRRLVEVVGTAALHGRGDGVSREQHGPEEGLLSLQVVGRDPHLGSTAPPTSDVIERLDHDPLTLAGCPVDPLGDGPGDMQWISSHLVHRTYVRV